ncbi:lamina-associated polypeptide 2-like [Xenopus laevis]|uniref:Lamina-associated polypeptide 2-like n=1 Tax=Xenopus laevis TaxID=8355 RepID=A0A8J1MHQ8_XENLA|nr:lamina-associated polypeptide 2-like [Xenopus laevis]
MDTEGVLEDLRKDMSSAISTPKAKKATGKRTHTQFKKCKKCKHTLRKGEDSICLDCADPLDSAPVLSPHPILSQDIEETPQINAAPQQNPSTSSKTPQIEELFDWIKSTIQSSVNKIPPHGKKRKPQLRLDTESSDSSTNSDQDSDPEPGELSVSEVSSDESDNEHQYRSIAGPDIAKRLLREMLATLEIKDETTATSKADKVLGVQPKKSRVFPVFRSVAQIIDNEWSKPDHRLTLTQRFLSTYPIPADHQKVWDRAPKVDSAIARLSKNTTLPTEDAAFKDPMDKKMEASLRKGYTHATAILRPAVASAGLARTARFWCQELLHKPLPPEELQEELQRLSSALAFLSDAAMDTVKLAAKTSVDTTVARRALWLRQWTGDTASKTRLINLKYTGDTLFGPDLKQIITEVTGGKSTFLPSGKRPRQESSSRPYNRQWNSQNRSFRPFRNSNFRSSQTGTDSKKGRPAWSNQPRQHRKPGPPKTTST